MDRTVKRTLEAMSDDNLPSDEPIPLDTLMATGLWHEPETPEERMFAVNLVEQTRRVLMTLTPREEKIVRMRFGIGEDSDHTHTEVAEYFKVGSARTWQIESKALRKLRHPSRCKRLKVFAEGLAKPDPRPPLSEQSHYDFEDLPNGKPFVTAMKPVPQPNPSGVSPDAPVLTPELIAERTEEIVKRMADHRAERARQDREERAARAKRIERLRQELARLELEEEKADAFDEYEARRRS
jgi:hypothetical protein